MIIWVKVRGSIVIAGNPQLGWKGAPQFLNLRGGMVALAQTGLLWLCRPTGWGMGVTLAVSIANSWGGVFCVASPFPPTMCILYLKWLGGCNVNEVKIGTEVSDI